MADALTKDVPTPDVAPASNAPYGIDDAIKSLLNPPEISPSPVEPAEAPEPETDLREAEDPVQSSDELPEEIIRAEPEPGAPDPAQDPQEEIHSTPERIYSVDIDGNTVQVTEAELLKGYRRQSDYTRKFQELAENRKNFEVEQQQTQQTREQYLDTIARVQQQIEASMPEYPPENLADVDREQYLLQAEQARQARERMHQLEQERQRVWQEHQATQQNDFRGHLAKQQEQMLEAIPEWQDNTVRTQESAALRDYAVGVGFSEQEAAHIYDARAVVLMRKAKAYDDLLSKGGLKDKEVRRKPTVVSTSGSRAATKSTAEASNKRLVEKASERFDKAAKGSVDKQDAIYAAADLLLARR